MLVKKIKEEAYEKVVMDMFIDCNSNRKCAKSGLFFHPE
jgi:hypothetical protein